MRCRFCLPDLQKFHISYLNATLKVKPAMALIYGETLIVAPIISIFIAGCVRDYRNLVVACGDAGYDAFVVIGR